MVKKAGMIEIPKALFEDEEVSTNRGEYIIRYMIDDGKEVPRRLVHQYGYFVIPQSIMVEAKKGTMPLVDLTFLFACYYVASTNKNKSIQMDKVFECITRNWDEFRTRNTALRFNFTLSNMDRYKRWIKQHEHNSKYSVKY
ncbi:hypothetical protein [Virgibacillus dokdonensis]|uniref:hypothetical protein n=1 Tax=Virgibacillus dokdonensis TaxID=302167 RepID=UPI00098B8DAE|nr:hypothetical protein [Virgibacillus dokdonensis]